MFSRLLATLQRHRGGLLLAGLLVLILGLRIYAGVRYLVEIPQGDDGDTVRWLQRWSQGMHDWGFIWRFHGKVHPTDLYYLANLGQYGLNGFWDGRLDFLVAALVRTLYAAVVFWTFGRLLTRRDRGWIYLFVFGLFAVPFAGHNVAWGMLWQNSCPMLFGLPVLYLVAYRGQEWGSLALACLLAALGALNTGAGCLIALVVLGLTLFQAILARRIVARDVVLSVVCLGIFLAIYLNATPDKHAGLAEAAGAFSKALSWPTVFVPGAGLLTLIPLAALVAAQFLLPRFRTREVTFVTGAYCLAVLIAFAAGALRGDNNNMGMPSGRYTDFFLVLPLITAVTLCLLYRGSTGGWRVACALLGCVWLGVQTLGFSVQIVYRVLPFMAQETGEWHEAQKQINYREVARGQATIPAPGTVDEEALGMLGSLADALEAHQGPPAMTTAMIAGFDLQPDSQGNFTSDGFQPSYQGRPARIYRGSYDRADRAAADRTFVSGVFRPQAPYITTDVLVDKKARFSNYRLDGLQLTLVDATDGHRTELLPRLARTFPFVLRDWEMIYAPVTPGHDYRLEARDASAAGWLAFSEPLESGRLTPLVVGLCQSGKLFCLCGLGLLAVAFYLGWLENSRPDRTPRSA